MDELIGQLAAKAGIDEAVAEKTIGIILGFLRSEGPSDKVQALIDTDSRRRSRHRGLEQQRRPGKIDGRRPDGARNQADGTWFGYG